MKISVTCPECETTYSVPEELAGKKFRCKKCPQAISIPAAPKPATKAEDEFSDNLSDDVWDSVPSSAALPAKKRKKANDGLPPKTVIEKPKEKKKKKKKSEEDNGKIKYIAISAVAVVCLIAAGLFHTKVFLCTGILLLGFGNLMTYVHAAENECAFYYRFIPFYAIYYTISNIGEVWHWALMRFAGVLFLIGFAIAHHAPAINQLRQAMDKQAEFAKQRALHRDEFQLTIASIDHTDDEDDGNDDVIGEVGEVSYSPTADVLRAKIKSLPWGNPKMYCTVMLAKPEQPKAYESIQLLNMSEQPNAPFKPGIAWTRIKNEAGEHFTSEPFAQLDDAIPVFEAFLKGDPEWEKLVKWKPNVQRP